MLKILSCESNEAIDKPEHYSRRPWLTELQVVSYITLAQLNFCKDEIVQWASWLVQAISGVTSSMLVAL